MNVVAKRVFPIPLEAREAPRVFVDQQRKDLGNEGIEAREGKFGDVLAGINNLIATHGYAALEALVAKLRQSVEEGRKPEKEALLALEQEHPDRKAFAQSVLDRFLRTGKITRRQDGSFVVPEEILVLSRKEMVQRTSFEHHPLAKNRLSLLLSTFEDVRVLQEHAQGEVTQVPVFYQPKTQEEAFSPEKIREATFQFAPFALSQWIDSEHLHDAHLLTAHERVSLLESMAACALYHPLFGDGKRNAEGFLEVRYQDGLHKRITGEWFKEMRASGLFSLPKEYQERLQDAPAGFVREHFSELIERKLLAPTDFVEKNTHEAKGLVKETVKTSAKGVVSFEGIRYNLGSVFKDCEIRIQKVTPDRAMVIKVLSSGEEKLAAFIRLFERASPEVKKNAVGQSFVYDAPVGVVDVRPYDGEGRGLFEGVSEEEHSGVRRAFDRAQHMVDFERKIRADGVTSLRTLPREHYDRVLFSDVVDKHRTVAELAVRETGGVGVEVLGMLADDAVVLPEAMKSLAFLPEVHQADFAHVLRDEVREYCLRSADTDRALQEQKITADQSRDLRFELRSRLLASFTVLREVKEEGADVDRILRAFQEQNAAFKNFGVLFKEACKGRDGLQLKDLQGVAIELRNQEREPLREEELAEMKVMFEENWKGVDAVAYEVAREGFLRALQDISRVEWITFKKEGKLLAFLRSEKVGSGDDRYIGSLNVAKSLQGSALGEQAIRFAVLDVGKEHRLSGHFVPSLLAGTSYIEQQGFVITGVSAIAHGGKKSRVVAIVREKDVEREALRLVPEEEKTFSLSGEGEQDMLAYIERMTHDGFVGTRFYTPRGDATRRTIVFSRAEKITK